VLDGDAWRESAAALLAAAATVEPEPRAFAEALRTGRVWGDGQVGVYFMLCSFALENLLKARIVAKKRSHLAAELKRRASLPKMLKEHDLYKLTREAGLAALAAEEEVLLHRLSRSAVWFGRYPVPVTASGLNAFRPSEHKDFNMSLTQYTTADLDDIKRLLREVGGPSATIPKTS
jgi:hypothetical protein